ncbi:hypothetical protein TELCIR_16596, partial [Teladorsagia circumcincta]
MASGNVEEGAVHIANAIALCGPSQQLLQIFQQTLPAEQYAAVIEQLPHTRARLAAMFGEAADHAESQPPVMTYMGDGPPPAQQQSFESFVKLVVVMLFWRSVHHYSSIISAQSRSIDVS